MLAQARWREQCHQLLKTDYTRARDYRVGVVGKRTDRCGVLVVAFSLALFFVAEVHTCVSLSFDFYF